MADAFPGGYDPLAETARRFAVEPLRLRPRAEIGLEAGVAGPGGPSLMQRALQQRQLELPLPDTPQPPRGIQTYHGSPETGLTSIDNRHAVEARGATFHATNPDAAELFTTPREYGEPVWDAPPGQVYPTRLDPRYLYEVPAPDAQRFIDDTGFQQSVIDKAIRRGHDAVLARNVKEGYGGEAIPTDVYAALRNEIVRMMQEDQR